LLAKQLKKRRHFSVSFSQENGSSPTVIFLLKLRQYGSMELKAGAYWTKNGSRKIFAAPYIFVYIFFLRWSIST
jgi:hypothetical protein